MNSLRFCRNRSVRFCRPRPVCSTGPSGVFSVECPARRESRRNDPSSRFGAASSEWMSRSRDFDLRKRYVGRRRIRSDANPSDPAVHFYAVVPSSSGETVSCLPGGTRPRYARFSVPERPVVSFRCAGWLFIAPQKGGFAAWDLYFRTCRPDAGWGSGCISASEPPAVSRLRREGRTFAASWKKSSCGSGFVSVLDSAFALNSKDIGRCFLFPRRMIWFSSLFRRGPMRPFPLRGICFAWSDEPCRAESAPVHGLRRNTIRTQASAASVRLSGSGRSLSPLFVNRGGMPFGTERASVSGRQRGNYSSASAFSRRMPRDPLTRTVRSRTG